MTMLENGKVLIYAPGSDEGIERFPIDASELVNEHGFTFEPVEPVKPAAKTKAE
jgi:hypothetical protein